MAVRCASALASLEAFSLMALSAGLATSVLAGQSLIPQAQAVIGYHLDRLFPASRPALRRAPMKGRQADSFNESLHSQRGYAQNFWIGA